MATRTVLLTGTSTGIGRETALHLARVDPPALAGVRRESDAASLRAEEAGDVRPVMLDVTRAEQVAEVAARIEAELEGECLDAVVNNAGIFAEVPLEVMPLDELRALFDVNVFGAMAVTQGVLPLLRRGAGRVIMISSMAGRVAFPIAGGYCASKFALEALSSALRMELIAEGIAVSIINVGTYHTAAWSKGADVGSEVLEALSPDQRERYGDMIVEARRINGDFLENANPMERVVRTIDKALNDNAPKPRYVAGSDARRVEMVRLLPDRIRERLVMKQLGL